VLAQLCQEAIGSGRGGHLEISQILPQYDRMLC
jgi:hypothetical protein